MKKIRFSLTRMTALLLVLVCMLGLLPATALAASPDSIKMEDCTHNGVSYVSPSLGTCYLHQMTFDYNKNSTIGFCAEKGKGMGWSLEGQTWGHPKPISDPTVSTMMAYYYAHTTGVFTDQAHALGVDDVWDSGYAWTMNAWVQAIVWRYKAGLLAAPVTACAEELMCVYNNLEHTNYSSIDDTMDGRSFRDRAQYILDLGSQGVWGECSVYEYAYTGSSTSYHQASDVQAIMIGELNITREKYDLTVKKVDATNPNKGLAGARFMVRSENGTYSKEIVTGQDGTYTLSALEAGTYSVTELEAPNGYQIDNPGPQYVVLPNGSNKTVTVTFTDTPEITGEGSIRKVDADDPTKGLAGAVIEIVGVDNDFTGTYVTGAGGYLTDVPWKDMPIGSYTATEVTPPEGYTKSPETSKVKQSFRWDGKTDVALVFENDAKVKVKLIKLDDSDTPLPGAVFNIIKDGQIVGTEATKADGSITVTDVTEGMYAFVEVSAPAPYATLTEPVIAHVDQATINGGGTVTVTAADKKLPSLTILKRDAQTKEVIPGTVFEIKGIHYHYHNDVTTGTDGKAVLSNIPVDSYEVIEKSVPDPYVVADEPTQTIYLGPGEDRELIFDNLKQPLLTIAKIDADTNAIIPGTVFTVKGIDSDYQNDVTTGADGTVSLRVVPGSYRITEKSVPSPYYLPSKNADREQTVSLNPGDEKTVMFKDHKAPELTIFKEDSVAGAPIEGAKFHVTYTSNGEAADAPGTIDFGYIFTDSNGQIKLHEQGKKMYPGEYTVTEVAPAPGFQMKEPTTQKVIIHGGESKTVTFQNEPLNAIIIEKYDSVTHEALPGCTFQLRYLGGTSGTGGTVIGQKVTGKNGTAIWTGLKSGTYVLEEVDPADGYSIINASETVYLADSGEQSVVTVRFDNSPDGILLVRKVCSVNPSITLQDAEFKITYADGTLIGDSNGIYRSDENGEIRIPGLKPGKSVVVTETRAPAGFIIDTQSQTVQIKEGRTMTLTVKDGNGNVLGRYTTGKDGTVTVTGLVPGSTVVVNESKVPNGYVLDTTPKTIIVKNGANSLTSGNNGGSTNTPNTGNNGGGNNLTFENDPKTKLVIEKYVTGTTNPLKGVTFLVTESNGQVVGSSNGEYVTDENGRIVIEGLEPGVTITAKEIKTLEGYVLDTTPKSIKIKVGEAQTLRFYNDKQGTIVVKKLDKQTNEPLAGVEFQITYSDGSYLDDDYGHLSSKGLYKTDANGEIRISGVVGTLVITETKPLPGYVMDEGTKTQTVKVNASDTQTITVYNTKIAGLTIIKKDEETGERIKGVQFEVRKLNGEIIGTYTTDANGVINLPEAEKGWYQVVELKAAKGYKLDDTPHQIEVKDGGTATLEITNRQSGSALIHKIDSVTGKGIFGVKFLLSDTKGNPVGTYESDNEGYVYIDRELADGRYTVREIECADGYILDTQPKTIYVEYGGCTTITWKNTAVTGQIQVTKTSADYNSVNGWPAGTPIPGTVFEIYHYRTGNLVDTIRTDKNGVAVSKPLPLGRYKVVESQAADFYGLDKTPIDVEIEHAGQIVKAAMTNKSLSTNVAIQKTGYAEVMPGQNIRYTFSNIANNSTTALTSFYWRDTLPVEAVRLAKITTGTYNAPGNYKIVYKTNLTGGEYRVLADSLNTQQNYVLEASPVALRLASNEYVTEVMFVFGTVPANFRQVEAPKIDCTVVSWAKGGSQFVNQADVGGVYNGQWIMATTRWVTKVYAPSKPLPRTGY